MNKQNLKKILEYKKPIIAVIAVFVSIYLVFFFQSLFYPTYTWFAMANSVRSLAEIRENNRFDLIDTVAVIGFDKSKIDQKFYEWNTIDIALDDKNEKVFMENKLYYYHKESKDKTVADTWFQVSLISTDINNASVDELIKKYLIAYPNSIGQTQPEVTETFEIIGDADKLPGEFVVVINDEPIDLNGIKVKFTNKANYFLWYDKIKNIFQDTTYTYEANIYWFESEGRVYLIKGLEKTESDIDVFELINNRIEIKTYDLDGEKDKGELDRILERHQQINLHYNY
jgi:hypothetical protein